MGTSERAFNQVKSILGKLDRSIDQAREKRLQATAGPQLSAPCPVPVPAPGPVQARPIARAQPLRGVVSDPNRGDAFQRWSKPS